MGSVTGALIVLLVFGGSSGQVALGAVVGGLVAAVIVYLLALRGGVQGYRLVLVGIGVSAVLLAVNDYLITRATRDDAFEAAHWIVGSVNGRGWEHVWPVGLCLSVLVPLAFVLARPMAMLEMGDDAARSLGVNAERSRLALIFVAVMLTAVGTASTGPIAFVALAAPQLARRLTRASAPGLGTSALMGALVLVASDLAAQRLFTTDLPVGVMTGAVGGIYLCWLSLDRMAAQLTRLRADDLQLAYDQRVVVEQLGLEIPDGSFTVIVGPNACGKSTLLRALARLLKPRRGGVFLDGELITSRSSKEVARELGLLPQSAIAPDGITAADLVARGRYPHQRLLRQWSKDDERAVAAAMEATRVSDLSERIVDELSGGQRQRVWLAMALAQETPILLLDEPTTFLDIAHQVEVLDLCAELHAERGRTLVAVLHDLNHACRYATHLVALRDGAIVAQGEPSETVTAELVERVFGLPCRVIADPETGTPLVIPLARGAVRPATY